MKKLFYFLVLISAIAKAQIVNIPDANFKAKLIALGTDTNSDGQIQESEALVVTSLNIPVSNIVDLTGIQSFTNLTFLDCSNQANGSGAGISSLNLLGLSGLTYLDCSNNSISNIDVTSLISLTSLKCNYNFLNSLNVSPLVNLTELECSHNQIPTLNLNANTNLTRLVCYSNQLTNLDLSNLNNLNILFCGENQLNTIDVSNLTNLTSFGCNLCGLTDLDVSNLTNLQVLDCDDNQISILNLQNQIFLNDLRCSGNLVNSIDLSNAASNGANFGLQFGNNPNLVYLNIKNAGNFIGFWPVNCPNLAFICANDDDIAFVNQQLSSYNIVGVNINSYCSFTPGGNYNTIIGTVTFDTNNNGCDASDDIQPNIRVNINDGTNQGATFTNLTANYSFYTQEGSFDLTPALENPTWFNFSPTSATIPFANNDNNTFTQDFCITANGVHPDLEIVIAPITRAMPGFDATYLIVYKNKGNQMLSGNITFTYDDTILDFSSATLTPDTQNTGLLNWNYTNLKPFEDHYFYVTLHVNAPTDTPAVNIGDVLSFQATIISVIADEIPQDNLFTYNETVVGSLDPNEVTCIEGNLVSPTEIGNYLHYVINFENTGTADAENIVVKDIIDVNQFDINSLQLMNSSAPVTARLTGNIAEFIFQNINLHSGGHGNILIKVKSKNTLSQGDTVSKKASIYFDYNFPVDTNMENTTFQALSTPDQGIDTSISIYPNPTKGIININCNNNIKSIQLFDVQGRLLQTDIVNETSKVIDISSKAKGVYFLKIASDKGSKVEKIVKD